MHGRALKGASATKSPAAILNHVREVVAQHFAARLDLIDSRTAGSSRGV